MSVTLRGQAITDYSDAKGNSISGSPKVSAGASVEFKGSNCRLVFGDGVRFEGAAVFHRDDAAVTIGPRGWYRGRITLGLGCAVTIGDDFYSGWDLQITTAEEAEVLIGDDVLVANQCRIRADDSHPIYDGMTGQRINPSQTITIGDHVWIGQSVIVLPGSSIGAGAMIGAASLVTASRPVEENSLAVGSPAAVLRRNIVWVRKHLQTGLDIDAEIAPVFAPALA